MAANQNEEFLQLIYADYSTNIHKKVLSKYLQRDSKKDLLSFFSL